MKLKRKSKIIFLIILGIFFTLSPTITVNLSFIINNNKSPDCSAENNFDKENLKISETSGNIHINNNWTATKASGICTGNGTYSEPYVIEDLVIDGGGGSMGSCILIENSDVYFRIENCTFYNSGFYPIYTAAGIELLNVSNGNLTNNNCPDNNNNGIYLGNSNNNSVSGNIANDNRCDGIVLYFSNDNTILGNIANGNVYGIRIRNSDNNTVSGNTANDNFHGLWIDYSDNNTISGNIMNECGLLLSGNLEMLNSLIIDTTNLVNGKPLYYYLNEINLDPNNFTNAGQVILVSCTDSLISNLNTSKSSIGISLHYCNNNNISGNTANLCVYGIYLSGCNYNTISGNNVSYNSPGIYLSGCNYNTISGNIANNNYCGIFLKDSNNNTVSGNTANNNRYGIILRDSNYNTISGNNLIGNDECIVEDNCEGSVFNNNDCGIIFSIPFEIIILITSISAGAVIGVTTLLIKFYLDAKGKKRWRK